MSIDSLRGLLRDFGAGIGLPDLAPDAEGYCRLKIGERITVTLQYEPQEHALVLFATLARIGEAGREQACEMMLSANLFWAGTRGCTLAVEPVEGAVMLLAKQNVLSLDLPGFNRLLEDFVEAGEDWQRQLEPFATDGDEALGAPPARVPVDYITLV